MQTTDDLGFRIIEESDVLEPTPINENTEMTETSLLTLIAMIDEIQAEIQALNDFTGIDNQPSDEGGDEEPEGTGDDDGGGGIIDQSPEPED